MPRMCACGSWTACPMLWHSDARRRRIGELLAATEKGRQRLEDHRRKRRAVKDPADSPARSAKNRRSEEEKEDVVAGGEAPPDPWDSEMEEILADSPAGVRSTSSVAATHGPDGGKKRAAERAAEDVREDISRGEKRAAQSVKKKTRLWTPRWRGQVRVKRSCSRKLWIQAVVLD